MSDVCQICGLPKDLCVCQSIAKESQKIIITTEKKKFRKYYTIIEGIDDKEINIKNIAKQLKAKFACGGTAKQNRIELQGNHKARIRDALVELGFAPETILVKQ